MRGGTVYHCHRQHWAAPQQAGFIAHHTRHGRVEFRSYIRPERTRTTILLFTAATATALRSAATPSSSIRFSFILCHPLLLYQRNNCFECSNVGGGHGSSTLRLGTQELNSDNREPERKDKELIQFTQKATTTPPSFGRPAGAQLIGSA